MSTPENNPRICLLSRSPLQQELAALLIDREARGLSPRTLEYYREKLGVFCEYLAAQGVGDVCAITARLLRSFLLDLAESTGSIARSRRFSAGGRKKRNPRTGPVRSRR